MWKSNNNVETMLVIDIYLIKSFGSYHFDFYIVRHHKVISLLSVIHPD